MNTELLLGMAYGQKTGGSSGGGTGTTNYAALNNKPKINGVTLDGNKTTADLNIEGYDDTALSGRVSALESGKADKTEIPSAYDDTALSGRVTAVEGKTVPSGGAAGQILAKKTAADNDTEWINPPQGGGTSYDDTALSGRVSANETAIQTLNGSGAGSVSKTVADAIAEIVANAPESLDTLKEISDWITSHATDAASMSSAITTLQGLVGGHTLGKDVPADAKLTDTVYNDTALTQRMTAAEADIDALETADTAIKAEITAVTNRSAKNRLQRVQPKFAKTESGITWTINDDGSVTVNGTATARVNIWVAHQDANQTVPQYLPEGEYIFSCLPSDTDTTQRNVFGYYGFHGEAERIYDYGQTITCNVNAERATRKLVFGLYVENGATVSDLTFYPMVRDASITDATYEPYAMSNAELTDKIANNDSGWLQVDATNHPRIYYRKKDDVVFLSFTMVTEDMPTIAANSRVTVATLPAGFRPTEQAVGVPCAMRQASGNVWTYAHLTVFTTGEIALTPQMAISGSTINAVNAYVSFPV